MTDDVAATNTNAYALATTRPASTAIAPPSKRAKTASRPAFGQGAMYYAPPEGCAPIPGARHLKKVLCAATSDGRAGILNTMHTICREHYSKGRCGHNKCRYMHTYLGAIVLGGQTRYEVSGVNTVILGECDEVAMERVKLEASKDSSFSGLKPYDAKVAQAERELRAVQEKKAQDDRAEEIKAQAASLRNTLERKENDDVVDEDGFASTDHTFGLHRPFFGATMFTPPGGIADDGKSSTVRVEECTRAQNEAAESILKKGAIGNYPMISKTVHTSRPHRISVMLQLGAVYTLQCSINQLCPGVCGQPLPEQGKAFLCPYCLRMVYCSAACAKARGHPQVSFACNAHSAYP